MRIIVTGGAGFIGSHVVELLAKKGNEIVVIDDLSTGNLDWIHALLRRNQRVHFDLCDIRNREHVRCAVESFRPEAICHLAAQPAIEMSWQNPARNAEVNEVGTLNLIASAIEFQVKRFIFASTSAVYSAKRTTLFEGSPIEPNSPYGISKMAAELYVERCFMTETVILRLGNVYGPRQMPIGTVLKNQVVPLILRHFLYGDEFRITGEGNQKRDYVFVEDVAAAFLAALYGDAGTYNIASGHSVSVNALCGFLEAVYGVPGYPWEHSPQMDLRGDVMLDVSKAKHGLGWKAEVSLQDGLTRTAEWWNNRK